MNSGKELYDKIMNIKFGSLEETLNYSFDFELVTELSSVYNIMLLDNYVQDNNLTKSLNYIKPLSVAECVVRLLKAKENDRFFYTLELINFRNPILNESLSLILKE